MGKLPEIARNKGNFNFQKRRAALESLDMFRPAERLALEDVQGFKQAIAIEKAAVENGDRGLRFRDKLAVEKDD